MKNANYLQPAIECVELDTQISLQLNSDPLPEEEPTDWVMYRGDLHTNDPVST